MRAAALALALAAAPAPGSFDAAAQQARAFTFSAHGWEMGIGPAEVYAFETFAPSAGGVGLYVTLRSRPARQLESLTASSLGETLALRDGDGATLIETVLTEPIRRGAFAVTFGDPADARRAAERMLGR